MSAEKKITIAIDGYSSCGKSTLAKALAAQLNYVFIDTGAMYRAVTLFLMRKELVTSSTLEIDKINTYLPEIKLHFERNSETKRLEMYLNDENVEEEIRKMEVSNLVSKVSTIREVRQKLVAEQQKMGENGGVVMDGRDIGSVVFPNAELKLFITASQEIRSRRRFDELTAKGENVTLHEISKNLIDRDYQDSNRTESPLIQTEDAIVIDNSEMSIDFQFNFVMKLVAKTLEKHEN
jgi:cytidylate kinase